MQNNLSLKKYWEKEYENTATQFDIEQPDRWVKELEQQGQIKGNILDSGCGPGRTSIYLAKLGYNVVGTDISNNAIERAKQKAILEKCTADFRQADMTNFTDYENYFDTVIDIGCFHSLPDERAQQDYIAALQHVCKTGATAYVRAFSDKNLSNPKHPIGVPAVSYRQIWNAFTVNGWLVANIEEKEIELLVANNQYKKGYCWFGKMENLREK